MLENGVKMGASRKHAVMMAAAILTCTLLFGCAQTNGAASEGEDPAQIQRSEIITEVETALIGDDVQSVTMEMKGSTSIDSAAIDAPASSSSAPSAAADRPNVEEALIDDDGEYGDEEYGEFDEYDEYDDYGDYEDEPAEGPAKTAIAKSVDAVAKNDRSGGAVRMQTSTVEGERTIDLYITGSDAVMVVGEQAVGATLQQLERTEYADIASMIRWQGGDITQFKDAVTNIDKQVDDDGALYTVTCDPAKYATANAGKGVFTELGKTAKLDKAELTYRVNTQGQLVGITANVTGTGVSHQVECKLYDQNATDVEEAPEPTMTYQEMTQGPSDEDDSEYYDEDYYYEEEE